MDTFLKTKMARWWTALVPAGRGRFNIMWFDPVELSKSAKQTFATFATSATFETKGMIEVEMVAGVAKVATFDTGIPIKAYRPALLDDKVPQTPRCDQCKFLRRPGNALACGSRTDLPRMWGLLHELPQDHGATCQSWLFKSLGKIRADDMKNS